MFNILASLEKECARLGFDEEAKIIKAWLSARLPHMTEETEFVHELYNFYKSISSLPPDHVVDRNFPFRHVNYTTAGKTVRQLMGEIGYLTHAVYEEGYLRHNVHLLSDEHRNPHIQFGLYLKDLVGLFGIYYNSANKEDVEQQELAQMAELFNTSIASMLGNLQREFAHVKGSARAMLQSSKTQYFLEDNQDIQRQADHFFSEIDELMLAIREVFYHSRSRIQTTNIESLQATMQRLHDFYQSLYDLDNHLSLEGQQYSPKALMYWSIVFSKKSKAKATQRAQRRQVVDQISDKPFLNEYAGIVETTSQLTKDAASQYHNEIKTFIKIARAIIALNRKLKTNLVDVVGEVKRLKNIITQLEDLKTIVLKVQQDHADLSSIERAEKAILDFDSSSSTPRKIEIQQTKQTVQNLQKAVNSITNLGYDFSSENLLNVSFEGLIKKINLELTMANEAIKNWYGLWTGEIDEQAVGDFYSHLYTIYNHLSEIEKNPIAHEDFGQHSWLQLFSFGNPMTEENEVTAGFSKLVDSMNLWASPYYLQPTGELDDNGKPIMEEEVPKERQDLNTKDLATKVSTFNEILESVLTGNPIAVDEEKQKELEEFVSSTNQYWRDQVVSAIEGGEAGDLLELKKNYLVSSLYLLGIRPKEEGDALSEALFAPQKPSLDELDKTDLSKIAQSRKRLVVAENGEVPTSFSIPYTVQQPDDSLLNRELVLTVNLREQTLAFTTLEAAGAQSRLIEKEIERLPDMNGLYLLLRNYFAESTYQTIQDRNEVYGELYPWYKHFVEEDEEEEEIQFTAKEVSPQRENFKKRMEKIRQDMKNKQEGLDGEPGKKKKKMATRPETIMDNLRKVPDRVSEPFKGKSLSAKIRRNNTVFENATAELTQQLLTQFSSIQSTISSIRDTLFESDLLPVFPRIVYNVYDTVNNASTGWKNWKTSKIEVVLNELRILIDNIQVKDKLEQQIRSRVETGLRGLPRSTIDMIDKKFEQLQRLIGAER